MKNQCWICTHRSVCKYWAGIADNRFPFADDSKIRPFMNAVAEVLAEACAWYDPRPEAPTPKA